MSVRPANAADREAWLDLRCALWPHWTRDDLAKDVDAFLAGAAAGAGARVAVLLYVRDDVVIGMIELSARTYAEGCTTSPVAFIEGWIVAPTARGQGIGRALVVAAEDWARAHGYRELGSDAELTNVASQAAHRALGFEEVERLVAYRKAL